MVIFKIGPYLGNRYSQSENKLTFNPIGVERERWSICNFWNLFKFQVLCPNMPVLKISLYLGNYCPFSENKLNFNPIEVEIEVSICNFCKSFQKKYPNMPILIITLYLGNGSQTYDSCGSSTPKTGMQILNLPKVCF